MITKQIYFAQDGEYSRKNKTQVITYYWDMDISDILFSVEVQTKGFLGAVYAVDSDKYLEWCDSSKKGFFKTKADKINTFKKQDYEEIRKTLSIMGMRLSQYFKSNNIEYYAVNCTEELKQYGFRELKDFEEKFLLDALKGE